MGWTLINSAASANAFAAALALTARSSSGNTAPGSALNFATPLFANNGFEGLRQVIDVSGDGERNEGANTADARDAALAAGVDAINGLAIGGASLQAWYAANIQGGAGSFVIGVNDFADFAAAIEQKLVAEIRNEVPEPGTLRPARCRAARPRRGPPSQNRLTPSSMRLTEAAPSGAAFRLSAGL